MKIAFITGITGQDGSYLTELLLSKNYKIYGIIRRTSLFNTTRIDTVRDKITLRYGDLTDGAGLSNYINEIARENENVDTFEIYNLAAQSHVKISFEIPEYTVDVDGVGVMKLLEIIRTLPKNIRNKIKFYQAGTSEMYGKVLEVPQSEKTPFNPVSPYGAAKLYAHHIVKIYREGYNLFAVNGILFNHESPRRGKNFVTAKIVNGVKEICEGKRECIELGNLDSKRDWGHSKDYVYGMWLMLQQNKPDDYVLATGKTYLIREFVERSFNYRNFTLTWHGKGVEEYAEDQNGIVRVKVNPKYYRPCEVDLLLGDPSKAEQILGWTRNYDLVSLIEDMFTM
tara:strand:+ start:1790 stop:2809 length:1020 start_codon:yes stop_codon:yes gene_type:complete